MAHHASAKKRIRQNEVRRLRNRSRMSTMRTAMKHVTEALAVNNLENIDALFREAQSVIAKTAKTGLIHRNNMARRISRLARHIQVAKAKLNA